MRALFLGPALVSDGTQGRRWRCVRLADVGLQTARFARITDEANETCAPASKLTTNAFDLDAISLVNAKTS